MQVPSFARRGRRWAVGTVVAAAVTGLALPAGVVAAAARPSRAWAVGKPTIILEHGAWADASSWSGVIERLQNRGFTVLAPPNPLRSGALDSAYLAQFLRTISGPIVLVGHSYGGFVVTNAATGNPAVKALVYVDAFIPDAGENLLQHTAGSCLGGDPAKTFNIVPSAGAVDLYVKNIPDPPFPGLTECFANGLSPEAAALVGAVQRPISANALLEPSGPPAWRTIPSWSLIGTADRVILPAEQQAMSQRARAHIVTTDAGHLSLVSRPEAVTDLIVAAAAASS
jgi:pimeloyl-ACP methyl ester carboxylesterase